MKLADYTKQRGRIRELAQQIGAFAPDVSRWASGKRPVPAHYCIPIEKATGGLVTRQELRPDDWFKYWPELAREATA